MDFQYLLTNNGKLRFKAYNHTYDRYTLQLRSSQFIQGIGLVYQESFNSWNELFGFGKKASDAQNDSTTVNAVKTQNDSIKVNTNKTDTINNETK